VLSVGIGIRVDGDSADPQLARCAYHPDGDLTPVGDEDLVEVRPAPRISNVS
jgi:hypothetical protein